MKFRDCSFRASFASLLIIVASLIGNRVSAQMESVPGGIEFDPKLKLEALGMNERWADLFAEGGISGYVNAVCANADAVFFGGKFTSAGGAPAGNIARWNRSVGKWSSNIFEGGIQGEVYALKSYGSTIYVGGYFDKAGSLAVSNIVKWNDNGFLWEKFDQGVDGHVNAIALADDGSLYIGGGFTGGFAKWTGTSWQVQGGGVVNAEVYALATLGTDVYVGGSFFYVGSGIFANKIAKWNGTEWSVMNKGVGTTLTSNTDYVAAIAINTFGRVVVGGRFSIASGTPASNVAVYDGANWYSYADMPGDVTSLVSTTQGMFIGGLFDATGRKHFVRSDNGGLADFGGTNGNVYAMLDVNDGLVVAGSFTTAGGIGAKGAAFFSYTPQYVDDIGFRPRTHGFSFGNSSSNMWPESWWSQYNYDGYHYWPWDPEYPKNLFPSEPLFMDAFRATEMINYFGKEMIRGSGQSDWRSRASNWGGSCTGFAFRSLAYFTGIETLPTGFTTAYALPIGDYVRYQINKDWTQQFSGITTRHIRDTWNISPTETADRLRASFKQTDRSKLFGLAIWTADGKKGHAVVPYMMKRSTNALDDIIDSVYVYDCNYPGDEGRVFYVNYTRGEWSYLPDYPLATRGLLPYTTLAQYRTEILKQKSKGAVVSADDDLFSLHFLEGVDVTLRRDGGAMNSLDAFKGAVPNASPIIPLTGGATTVRGFALQASQSPIAVEWKPLAASSKEFTTSNDKSRIVLHAVPVTTTTDRFIVNGMNDSILVVSNGGYSRIDAAFVRRSDTYDNTIMFANSTMAANDSIAFRVSEDGTILRIYNYAGEKHYDLELRHTGRDTTLSIKGLVIPARSHKSITIGDFDSLRTTPITATLDRDMDGSIDSTFALTGPTASVRNHEGHSQISVFPNPARSITELEILSGVGGTATIRLVDVLGRCALEERAVIQAGTASSIALDLSGLSAASYRCEISMPDGETRIRTVVVAR